MTRKLFMIVALGLALYAAAQDHPQSNERRNLGFKGPVHSALVTVERPNPDPRARDKRALFLPGGPDSIVFDTNGSRIEFATGFSGDQIVQTSTRTAIKSDGTEIWTNSQGNASETRKQYAVLADGSREVTYYSNSQVTNREVTRFDDQGRIVEFHNYNAEGNLISEQSTSFNHQRQIDTFKLYDQHGRIVHETRTAIAGEERLDRWQYDSGGQLGWHVAVNGKG